MRQDLHENFGMALDTLRTHKLRSFLTVLGVIIGTMVIIGVGSVITGFDQDIIEQISGFGVDTAFIYRFDQGIRFGHLTKQERMRKPLTLEDGEAILESCPAVRRLAVSLFEWEHPHSVRYKDQEVVGVDFRGTFPEFVDVYANATLKTGRFFTQAENLHRLPVVVLGADVAKTFFPNVDPIGKQILIDGQPYEVLGVFEKPKGGFGDRDEDRRVVLPYHTFTRSYPAAEEHGIRIQAYPGQLNVAVDEAREVMRRRRRVAYGEPDNFSIQTSQNFVDQFHQITGAVALVMVVLSSIGLLVGGVGVMNIMLVSVTERTREIGVRKAIGARRRDIAWQFLLEAMTLTGSGGLIGILVGAGFSLLINVAVPTIPVTVPLWSVLVGFVVSVSVGLIFGMWPALKAARLDPVEALRYE